VLFDSTMEKSNEYISQHVVKMDNGRSFTLKTPGKIGHKMVRIILYDVKDISHKDKHNWWRHAKLTQFLNSRNDRKQQLLRQLLDCC